MDAHALTALREKYVEMRRLRLEDAEGRAGDPKPAMAALAERFPGALREIDDLPLDDIEARIAALDAALDGTGAPPAWAPLFASYHGWMRAALRIKRLCRGLTPEDAIALVHTRYTPADDEPPITRLGEPELRAILTPQYGRLNPFVFARVAEDHTTDIATVMTTLFPRRP